LEAARQPSRGGCSAFTDDAQNAINITPIAAVCALVNEPQTGPILLCGRTASRCLEQACLSKRSMTPEKHTALAPDPFDSLTIDFAIRIGLSGLLGYGSLKVIGPFPNCRAMERNTDCFTLYPLFDRVARTLSSRRLAAIMITLLCPMIVIGPVTWLGFELIGGVETRGPGARLRHVLDPVAL
jgi:hypothetical protein